MPRSIATSSWSYPNNCSVVERDLSAPTLESIHPGSGPWTGDSVFWDSYTAECLLPGYSKANSFAPRLTSIDDGDAKKATWLNLNAEPLTEALEAPRLPIYPSRGSDRQTPCGWRHLPDLHSVPGYDLSYMDEDTSSLWLHSAGSDVSSMYHHPDTSIVLDPLYKESARNAASSLGDQIGLRSTCTICGKLHRRLCDLRLAIACPDAVTILK